MWEKTGLLILLIAANGAPILLAWSLGQRWNWPLDGGLVLGDGAMGTMLQLAGLTDGGAPFWAVVDVEHAELRPIEGSIADWGPAEDWSDWVDATR